jgi:hypothetical protein
MRYVVGGVIVTANYIFHREVTGEHETAVLTLHNLELLAGYIVVLAVDLMLDLCSSAHRTSIDCEIISRYWHYYSNMIVCTYVHIIPKFAAK